MPPPSSMSSLFAAAIALVFAVALTTISWHVRVANAQITQLGCPRVANNAALFDCASADCKCSLCGGATQADFTFLIDCSSSMQRYIDSVRRGLPQFVSQLQAKNIDARYNVILYGAGAAEVIEDWVTNGDLTRTVLQQVIAGAGNEPQPQRDPRTLVHFDHDCKLERGCGTRESALETLRMALSTAANNRFVRHPNTQTARGDPADTGNSGRILFRPTAQKYVFLVTDEDSDCPFYDANRQPNQCTAGDLPSVQDGSYQPESPQARANWAPWQAEIDATAQMIVNADAKLSMFMLASKDESMRQFGRPAAAVQNADFSMFNGPSTLANLLNSAVTADSLQAKVLGLKSSHVMRLFDIERIVDQRVIEAVFTEVVAQVVAAGGEVCSTNQTNDPCFSSSCDPVIGCVSNPVCSQPQCGHCQIAGVGCVSRFSRNPANACEVCDGLKSADSWTNSCDDGDACTVNSCVANKCVSEPVCTPACGYCCIGGALTTGANAVCTGNTACPRFGDIEPLQTNPCIKCDATAPTAWTDLAKVVDRDGKPLCEDPSNACPAEFQPTNGAPRLRGYPGCYCNEDLSCEGAGIDRCASDCVCRDTLAQPDFFKSAPNCAATTRASGAALTTVAAPTAAGAPTSPPPPPSASVPTSPPPPPPAPVGTGTIGEPCPCLGSLRCSPSLLVCEPAGACAFNGLLGCTCLADAVCTTGVCDTTTNRCVVGGGATPPPPPPVVGCAGCACSLAGTCNVGLQCNAAHQCQQPDTSAPPPPPRAPPPPPALPGCTQGTLNCRCSPAGAGDACASGLVCALPALDQCLSAAAAADANAPPPPPPPPASSACAGSPGCACAPGNVCSSPAADVCSAGVCASCRAGALGCACASSSACDDGLVCTGVACVRLADGCASPGDAGCACLEGACNPGYECDGSGVCVARQPSIDDACSTERRDTCVRACGSAGLLTCGCPAGGFSIECARPPVFQSGAAAATMTTAASGDVMTRVAAALLVATATIIGAC